MERTHLIVKIFLLLLLPIVGFGQIEIQTNFEPAIAAPLDTRLTIATLADTSTIVFPYLGLVTWVTNIAQEWQYSGSWNRKVSSGIDNRVPDILTSLGVVAYADNMGSYPGTIVPDAGSVKDNIIALEEAAQAARDSIAALRVDIGAGAADGVVTGGSVSGTNLTLTRSIGGDITIAGLPSGNTVDSVVFAYTTSQINDGFVSWDDGETLVNITKKDTVIVHFSFNDNSITTLFNTASNDSIVVNYNEGNGWEKIAENQNVTKTFGTFSERFLSVKMPKQDLIAVDFLGGFNFNIAEFLVFENMTGIDIHDRNTVTGDINNLPSNIGTLDVRGNNTLYGTFTATTNLPTVFFRITGANTVTGDMADIPSSVVYFGLTGGINITGDIADMPPNLVHTDITGTSTFSGNLANIPPGLTGNFTLGGQNTITGDIANIPVGVSDVTISGNNTVSGNIGDITAPYTRLVLTGQSAPTGTLADINSVCTYIYIDTPNATITGDIADINAGTTFLYARGLSTIEDYSANPGWPSVMSGINIRCNTNFTTTELDNLLIDLDAATTSWNGVLLVAVNGAQTRSAASDAAVTSLQSKGVTVTLN
jgi:hypothetical protein